MSTQGLSEYYVYFIMDPREEPYSTYSFSLSHKPFYIGKGINNRFKERKNKRTEARIKEIKSKGYEPKYLLLPLGDEKICYNSEASFIKHFKREIEGGPLLNVIRGGDVFMRAGTNGSWNKNLTKEKIRNNHWSKGPNAEKIKSKLREAALNQFGVKE